MSVEVSGLGACDDRGMTTDDNFGAAGGGGGDTVGMRGLSPAAVVSRKLANASLVSVLILCVVTAIVVVVAEIIAWIFGVCLVVFAATIVLGFNVLAKMVVEPDVRILGRVDVPDHVRSAAQQAAVRLNTPKLKAYVAGSTQMNVAAFISQVDGVDQLTVVVTSLAADVFSDDELVALILLAVPDALNKKRVRFAQRIDRISVGVCFSVALFLAWWDQTRFIVVCALLLAIAVYVFVFRRTKLMALSAAASAVMTFDPPTTVAALRMLCANVSGDTPRVFRSAWVIPPMSWTETWASWLDPRNWRLSGESPVDTSLYARRVRELNTMVAAVEETFGMRPSPPVDVSGVSKFPGERARIIRQSLDFRINDERGAVRLARLAARADAGVMVPVSVWSALPYYDAAFLAVAGMPMAWLFFLRDLGKVPIVVPGDERAFTWEFDSYTSAVPVATSLGHPVLVPPEERVVKPEQVRPPTIWDEIGSYRPGGTPWRDRQRYRPPVVLPLVGPVGSPAWLPDPYWLVDGRAPGRLRWWDGAQWSPVTSDSWNAHGGAAAGGATKH